MGIGNVPIKMAATGSVCRRLFSSPVLWQWRTGRIQNTCLLREREKVCFRPWSGMSWLQLSSLRRASTAADPSVKSDSGSFGAAETATSSEKLLHLSDSCVEVRAWAAVL